MTKSKSASAQWEVQLTAAAAKQKKSLPDRIEIIFDRLLGEMEKCGPIRTNWKNYSKLSNISHHCHLKKGKTTYVACWRVEDRKIKIIEVYYVGTHEKAPY
jgi:mRNA-degrading endonuclease RelE of RelBE toxin-antitoxin system